MNKRSKTVLMIVEDYRDYARKTKQKLVGFIILFFTSLRSSCKGASALFESFTKKASVARRPLLRELLEENYLDVLNDAIGSLVKSAIYLN